MHSVHGRLRAYIRVSKCDDVLGLPRGYLVQVYADRGLQFKHLWWPVRERNLLACRRLCLRWQRRRGLYAGLHLLRTLRLIADAGHGVHDRWLSRCVPLQGRLCTVVHGTRRNLVHIVRRWLRTRGNVCGLDFVYSVPRGHLVQGHGRLRDEFVRRPVRRRHVLDCRRLQHPRVRREPHAGQHSVLHCMHELHLLADTGHVMLEHGE